LIDLAIDHDVPLTCTAEVSSKDRTRKGLLLNERRSARTPPSTFLFLPIQFSNSPGVWRPPSPIAWRVSNLRAPDNRRALIHCSSEELRRHAIAPKIANWRAACRTRYIGEAALISQQQKPEFLRCRTTDLPVQIWVCGCPPARGINRRAVLKPYSWAVLAILHLRNGRATAAAVGVSCDVRPAKLTGQKPTGIVPDAESETATA
jgi:hypothetical protein